MAAFAPDVIVNLGPLPVTNTLIHTLIVDGILIGIAIYLFKRIQLKPSGLQAIIEPIIDGLYSLTEGIAPTKKALNAIFPFVATFFLFIFVSNFTGLLPGVGTIGFFPKETPVVSVVHASAEIDTNSEVLKDDKNKKESSHSEFIPLLRGATSDINVTFALSIVSVVATHILSIQLTGLRDYLSRWISFNPINLYVGLLELIAEFTKIISLSFRLFGNIYAGEVALHTVSSLFAFIAPIPFLLLESIVSIVQALVFAILTLVFMSVLTKSHHQSAHEPAYTESSVPKGHGEVVKT